MLLQFNFKNYKSFADEVVLDMTAAGISELQSHVIEAGKESILPVAAIYGANASGKSNVYGAFRCMTMFVTSSFEFGGDSEKFEIRRPKPFHFSVESEDSDTLFEVYFMIPEDESLKTYNYGFCVNREGITEEWLNVKAKTSRNYKSIFYRNERTKETDLSGLTKLNKENISIALEDQVLISSLGAKLRVKECKIVYDWFNNNECTDFGNPLTSIAGQMRVPKKFVEESTEQEKMVKFLSSFDDSIKGFHTEKIQDKDDEDEPGMNRWEIQTLHKMIDCEEYAEISLRDESAGTLKMFSLYPEIQRVMKTGGVYFVDELNARLHPLLVRLIVLAFLNPEKNIKHAQLIFTTHDTWHLSNHSLRRDEKKKKKKDKNGISTMYSLADFKDEDGKGIRKDESYERNYLTGKYGAIPTLSGFEV